MSVAFNGNTALAKLFIEKGAKINLADKWGYTALIYSARNGKSEMINELIQAGANVNAQDKKGWTALMWVAHWGPSKSKAILYKQISEASILIKAKANVNAIGEKGETALSLALNSRNSDIINLLKENGAK